MNSKLEPIIYHLDEDYRVSQERKDIAKDISLKLIQELRSLGYENLSLKENFRSVSNNFLLNDILLDFEGYSVFQKESLKIPLERSYFFGLIKRTKDFNYRELCKVQAFSRDQVHIDLKVPQRDIYGSVEKVIKDNSDIMIRYFL